MKKIITLLALALFSAQTAFAQTPPPQYGYLTPSIYGLISSSSGSTISGGGTFNSPYTIAASESLGTKLRRLATTAATQGNAWSQNRPYMKAVPPWQPSTAVYQSYLVVNGGQIYTAVNNGTTASSGGPTGSDISSLVSDNTVNWSWWGPNVITSDPSITQNAWAASTAYTAGTQVINNNLVYAVVAGGTSASSGGPTGTGNAITDGTVTWTYMGVYRPTSYTNDFPSFSLASSLPGALTNVYSPGIGVNLSAQNALVYAGGTGYVNGDTITLNSGVSTTATVLTVTNAVSGVIQPGGISITTPGVYSTIPPTSGGTTYQAQASTSGSGTGAEFFVSWSNPSWYALRGASVLSSYSSPGFVYVGTLQGANNAAITQQHYAMEFYSDSPKLAIQTPNASSFSETNVIIDGVRYSLNGLTHPTNASNYAIFDFSSTSGRKKRLWRLESTSYGYLGRIAVDTNSSIWAPDNDDVITAAIISDSIVAGYSPGPFVPGNTVSLRLGQELNWRNVWDFSIAGTGYVAPGSAAPYSYRIAQAALQNPNIWILFGSTNDNGQSGVTSAVTSTLTAIRATGSTAPIVVFGVWPTAAYVATLEPLVQTGVTNFSDPLSKTFYIPLYYDPYLPWITNTYNNNPAPSGITAANSTNYNLYINSSFAPHPVDPGTEYLAKRMANAIRANVLPYLQ